MNKRFACALPLILLLGCSTPRSTPELPGPLAQFIPPPEVSIDLPLEQPREYDGDGAAFCHLGTSCMAMDPRPFEACLVSGTKRCVDKATEPLLVVDPSTEQAND